MNRIRAAFFGAGGIAATHAKALVALNVADIVGVCSPTPNNSHAFSATYAGGKAECFTDFSAMLDAIDPRILIVAVPPYAHHGEVELAAARGIHLLLEKPIALDLARAVSIRDAVHAAGIHAVVGHHFRFSLPVLRLHALLADGTAGRPTLFTAAYLCNALHSAWWRDIAKSGGQTLEQVIHLYDIALFLLGPAESISARLANLTHTAVPGYTSEDTAAALIHFANGAIATISSSNGAKPQQWDSPFRLVCQNLTAEFSDPKHAIFTRYDGHTSEHFWSTNTSPEVETLADPADLYLEQMRSFIDAVRGRPAPDVAAATVDDAVASLALTLAAIQSSNGGGIPIRPRYFQHARGT